MSCVVTPLILLELHFKTLLPINKLPHFHGPQWSALFRDILKPYLPIDMPKVGFWVHPVETGILSYEKDEPIYLGVTFPASYKAEIFRMLADFNDSKVEKGHFQPGRTIFLEGVVCRITGDRWKHGNNAFLSEDLLRDEIEMLSGLSEFSICFHAPLRLPRPEGHKEEGHHFCDEDFFFVEKSGERTAPIQHLISRIRLQGGMPAGTQETDLKVSGGALMWLDISYGQDVMKTIGGVVGRIRVSGKPSLGVAERLVLGQYTGAGKNPVFGLGFYHIRELDGAKKIRPLVRGKTLLERGMSFVALKSSLDRLPNSSPGPDMLTLEDIKKGGKDLLESISRNVIEGKYVYGGLKKYRYRKDDGNYREICVSNTADRLVQRAIADHLLPVVDRLLSTSSYAYRRGLNRKGAASALRQALQEGYAFGLKADISAFFDSVNIEILGEILEGLLPFEPLVERIKRCAGAQGTGSETENRRKP